MAPLNSPQESSPPQDLPETEMPILEEINGLPAGELFFRLVRESPTAIFIAKPGGRIVYANKAFLNLTGYRAEKVASGEIGWRNLRPDGFTVQDAHALEQLKRHGQCEPYAEEFVGANGRRIPVYIAATGLTRNDSEIDVVMYVTDITDLRETEAKLRELQWLLEENIATEENDNSYRKTVVPDESAELVSAVGLEPLTEMVNDFVRLLGTNATIYDTEGNLVIGTFGREWCGFLQEKRNQNMCIDAEHDRQPDTRDFCFASHWEEACCKVLTGQRPLEADCHGGIKIYAVPILAENNMVGVMCAGIGIPPTNDMRLCSIAQRHGISPQELKEHSNRYRYRPPFIQSIAKKRLEITARILGIIVERHRARLALQDIREGMDREIESRTEQLRSANERLANEVEANHITQKELSLRQGILEAVYDLATSPAADTGEFLGKTAGYVAQTLRAPLVSVSYAPDKQTEILAEVSSDGLSVIQNPDSGDERCAIVPERGTIQKVVPNVKKGRDIEGLRRDETVVMLGVPLCSGEGTPLGAVCVFDRNDRVFGEREIHVVEIYARYVAHELSRRVLERQLRLAQEMRVLGQLTSGVAHEVRNPLNAIQAIMEALQLEIGGNADIEPFLAHIHQQVGRLSNLMEDLLQLGRCPRNIVPVRVTVGEMLRRTVHAWLESAPPRNRTIDIIRGIDDDRQVMVDIDRMNQVFVNLIENALQHSPAQTPVTVSVWPSEGSNVVISITDQGTGLREDELQRVFEPFYSTRKHGTGLGLSIVKRLIDSHGGKIELRNNEHGPGLTAEIYLPRAE